MNLLIILLYVLAYMAVRGLSFVDGYCYVEIKAKK